jgi:hypothetical protein
MMHEKSGFCVSGATKRRNGLCDCRFWGGAAQEAHMRRALNVALVVAGVLVNVMTSRSTTVASSQAALWPVQNGTVVYGLHVALPSDMKYFPPELVPLP